MLTIFTPFTDGRYIKSPSQNSNHHAGHDDSDESVLHSTKTTVLARRSPECDSQNNTQINGQDGTKWKIICDVDFYAQDIYPFTLAGSFEECMQHCEHHNKNKNDNKCVGFLYAPDRSQGEDDCYLKNGLDFAISPSSVHLIGASLISATGPTTSTWAQTDVPTTTTPSLPTSTHVSPIPPSLGSGRRPVVAKAIYLGTSTDEVARQYVSHTPAKPQQLNSGSIKAGINVDLITGYELASDSGTWTGQSVSENRINQMTVTPRIARDGGRGGNINGTNVFIFCDTSTYGEQKDPIFGYLNGFVSSSVAIDSGMNALSGKPLHLVNTIGQWQDDVGRMRGFVPMTVGEEAFNTAISGQGYRYAVWPNSSPIPLNNTHAIMYAPLIYLEVDMQEQTNPSYTSLGNTLLLITVDPEFGPHAERLESQFYGQNEINWGSLGGLRSRDKAGINSNGGDIYLLGQVSAGIMIAKVPADDFNDKSQYSFWNGQSWSKDMPPSDSSSNALLINQPVMSVDLIYSPAHQTFIMIYLTPEADNTFYYRYLQGKDNSTLSNLPSYTEGGEDDYFEQLLTNEWSEQHVLFNIPKPERGYAYAGGIHAGYFGVDDISIGGTKALFTWTEHTLVDPNRPESGYAHKSQVIEFGFEV